MDNDHQNVTEFPELTNRSESIKNLTSLLTNNNTLCHPSSISMGEHVHGPTFSANGTALAATSAKSNKIPSRASRCFRPCPVRSQFSQFRRPVPINNVLAKFNHSHSREEKVPKTATKRKNRFEEGPHRKRLCLISDVPSVRGSFSANKELATSLKSNMMSRFSRRFCPQFSQFANRWLRFGYFTMKSSSSSARKNKSSKVDRIAQNVLASNLTDTTPLPSFSKSDFDPIQITPSKIPAKDDPNYNEPAYRETFYQIVKEGSIEKLEEFQKIKGLDETVKLASTFNDNGETPLLLAIGGGHFQMVTYLIEKMEVSISEIGKFLWDEEYLEGPPLFAAILFAQASQSPAPHSASIVDVLIDYEIKHNHHEVYPFAPFEDMDTEEMERNLRHKYSQILYPVLVSVKNSKSITRQRKIEILELIGSTYVLKNPEEYRSEDGSGYDSDYSSDNNSDGSDGSEDTSLSFDVTLFCGIECWVQAMRLRESTADGEPAFPKVRYDLPDNAQNILRFHDKTEFETMEELREIIHLEVFRQTGKCYSYRSADDLRYQAILMSLRILSQFQPDMRPFLSFLRHVTKHLPFLRIYESCFIENLPSFYMRLIVEVSTFLTSEDVDDGSWPFHFVETVIENGLERAIKKVLFQEDLRPEDLKLFTFNNIMKFFYVASAYVEKLPLKIGTFYGDSRKRNNALLRIHDAIAYLIKHLLRNLNEEECQQFSIWLRRFVRVTEDQCVANPRFIRVKSLLHIACEGYSHPFYTDIIEMLLEAGADPNLRNGDYNNTPAHCVAKNNFRLDLMALTSLELLVDAGAHLNQVNERERTALEDFRRRFHDCPDELAILENVNAKSCLASESDMRLTCLCAGALRRNRIVYDEEKYPSLLVPFLESHGAKTRIRRT